MHAFAFRFPSENAPVLLQAAPRVLRRRRASGLEPRRKALDHGDEMTYHDDDGDEMTYDDGGGVEIT